MKALAASLVAASMLLEPAPPEIAHPDYGVVTSVQYLDGLALERLRELGAGAVRVGMGWDSVESTRGRYDFSYLGPWVDNARKLGLHVLLGLGDPPAWAAPCRTCAPYDLRDWYDYVYQVISYFRYAGDTVTFGIWNEPNLGKFLSPPDPDLYGDLFDYADMARRDANRFARLAGPETDHGALASGWLAAVLGRLAPRLLPQDVIAVHWYPGTHSPPLAAYMNDVLTLAGDRETWLTETGEGNFDDATQASRLSAIVETFDRRPSSQWARMFVYRLAGEGTDPDVAAQLLRPDFSLRPSFLAYRDRMYRARTVNLRAANGWYVSADEVLSDRLSANSREAGERETFELDDLNGGSLRSGDYVRIRTSRGVGLRVPADRSLRASDACVCSIDGLFVATAVAGPPSGDEPALALRAFAAGRYVSAVRFGGWLTTSGLSFPGAWETFQVIVR